MALFGKKTEIVEPPPSVKPEELAEVRSSVDKLADTVTNFISSQNKPVEQPVEDDMQFRPEAPPQIEDINDNDYDEAMEEGGARARKAADVRRKADAARLKWDSDQRLAQVAHQGTRAINDNTVKLALQDANYYHSNTKVKAEVDKQLGNLKRQGVLLDTNAIQWIYRKAVGDNVDDLLTNTREETVRKMREPEDVTARGGAGRAAPSPRGPANDDVPQPEDLTPEAANLLSSRNRGRGLSPDEFAKSLPPHRYYDYTQRKHITRKYDSWADYMDKSAETNEMAEQQRNAYFGRNN